MNPKVKLLIAFAACLVAFGAGSAMPAFADAAPKSEKAKAYGNYCKELSKKKVKGDKGTPFSQCVTAMAKLDRGATTNPRKACKELSKKRAEGEKHSDFVKCVQAGKKLKRDKNKDAS